jgi:hypothetical protein
MSDFAHRFLLAIGHKVNNHRFTMEFNLVNEVETTALELENVSFLQPAQATFRDGRVLDLRIMIYNVCHIRVFFDLRLSDQVIVFHDSDFDSR